MAFTREDRDENIRLTLEGAMSIYEVSGLREELFTCFETEKALELDLGEVTDCDTAGIQLLYAAQKTAEERQKGFSVIKVSQAVLDVLQSAGLGPQEILQDLES